MPQYKNVFIYVSDALRLDHIPESIASEGNVIPTLAPAAFTPVCMSSMVTGLSPEKHDVRSFNDVLKEDTVFDCFENHCYYDRPTDPLAKNILRNYDSDKELDEIEEPFFYLERALDTHLPYGVIGHGNEIPDEYESKSYAEGVKSTEEHFWQHVEKLKELGIYEDTLIIFTSDHGELLGEKMLFRERGKHNKPVCRELNVVPTVFLNYENDWECMRTIDIAKTAASLAGKEFPHGDGIDINKRRPREGKSLLTISNRPVIEAKALWKHEEGEWKTVKKLKADIYTILSDHLDPIKNKFKKKLE